FCFAPSDGWRSAWLAQMIGHVRDGFPFVQLAIQTTAGSMQIEFIVDTAFDGELSIPSDVIRRLDARYSGERQFLLANGRVILATCYELSMSWFEEEERIVEVVALEGRPLVGSVMLDG